ncbi:hypothetical protein AB1Y20_006522 [Prymnesium parvum]|uniref:non-specific serine/threonine protein kinase n=1 Tax=Prymnesium parvum TaxID=97485 RepID=A0AB34IYB6_PRYPA
MRGQGGGNGDRLHQVDRALAYTERTSGTLQELLSVADVLLKVGEAVPIFGPACKVARDILAEVSASADKVDDVLEAGRRVVDTLKVLNILKENLTRLGGAERAELESVMRGLESLLQDMKEVLLSFRSRGWFKRVIQLGKHAKTLKRLDGLIRDKMELAMSLYRFAQDAAASATQNQLLQLLQERSYALEEAVAEKVDERVRGGRMTEEAAIADLENDADALSDVARTARISEQALLDEFRAFGAEVCKQYEHVQESLMKINAAVEALRQRPANGLDLYEYVRKPNAKPRATDKKAATLGSGSFGTTYQMRKRHGVAQLLVAVKVINEDAFDSEDADEKDVLISAEKLEREAVQLSLMRHPSIVQYIEAFWHESDDEGRQFVIVTELLTGGSFTSRTIRRPLPTEEMLATWLGQIASGLAYLHEERMLHRDLKPDNVLFDSRDRAKIIDLGLACTVDSKSRGKTRSGGSSGTNLYMSPEKCLGAGHDSKEDDIWALGCLLAAGLVGDPLLGASGKYNFALHRPNVEKLIGDSCRESKRLGSFVRAMLEQDPRRRPTAHQVVQQLLVQEPGGGIKGETDEVARLKEQLAQATAAKEAAEKAAAERFAAAEKAAAEKAAATERAAAEKAAAEKAAAEKAAAEKASAEKAAATERAAAEEAAAEKAAAEKAAAEKAAAEKASAEKEAAAQKAATVQKAAAVQKADAQPSAAAFENFCRKVRIRDVQSVRQEAVLDWNFKQLNADDCKVIAYLIASGALANLTKLYLSDNQIGLLHR